MRRDGKLNKTTMMVGAVDKIIYVRFRWVLRGK